MSEVGRDRPQDDWPSVLLVDDRAENLLALESVLESLPLRAVRALSAAEALARVEEERFALILLDVQMPGTDGLETARLIKARERGGVVPILFITAQDRDRRRVTTAYEAGAVDYLFKPLDPEELRAKVAAFLDLYYMHARDRDRRRRYADRLVNASEERYRHAAETAKRALAAVEVADQRKAEFLSRMSHELRTPLNAILGYVQLLDIGIFGEVTPGQHAHLNRIRQSAVHLLSLVNEILDLVTLDTEALEVERVAAQLGDVCDEAMAVVRIEAALRNLTVVGLPAENQSATYLGDPNRVRQVIVHLLTNAVKFTMPGGGIALSCGTSTGRATQADAPPGGPWAYVRVTDTGPGIAPEYLERIFDPFTQADGGLTRAQDGAGLGLTISRRLARAMGGEVSVESEPGRTSFTLWLPSPHARAQRAPSAAPKRAEWEGLSPDIYRRLTALGTSLTAGIDHIAEEHAARLRGESVPNAEGLPEAQLRDHLSTFINEIALVLRVMGETEARAPELLRDGSDILRLISELHGAQRERLGWGESDVERELGLVAAAIEEHLQAAAESGTDTSALEQALLLVRRLLEQSRQASFRGFRLARRGRPSDPSRSDGPM